MYLISKLNTASFLDQTNITIGYHSRDVGFKFNFNFNLYKENQNYTVKIEPIVPTEFGSSEFDDCCLEYYTSKVSLNVCIGNKNIDLGNILNKYLLKDDCGYNGFLNHKVVPITFNFKSAENIDVTKLKISFSCYKTERHAKSETYAYTFEKQFNAILCNRAPEITNVQASFPTVSFNVSDDKKVNKVEVFINNSLKRTIVNGLNDRVILKFNNNDFNIGSNTMVLRAIDNENVFTNKSIKVTRDKVPIPKKGIEIVKNTKIYKIIAAEENVKADELTLTLDRNLEEVSSIDEPIEILDKYAIVKINDKPMKHISSKNIANNEVEDKFELDITTRKVTLRVDLERVDSYGSIYIREIQEAFQYNKD